VPAEELRGAARLYARGGNGAIYYGLGVTEHSQGSTTVMAIANLAMATGNIGRPGVGVNPLRGQNNVQGACDMGSFPHELPGYRHISGTEVRDVFEKLWGVELNPSRACAFPTCSMRPSTARSAASTSRARTSCSPIPTPSTSRPGWRRWNASSSMTCS
jgi:formate dehydrogenase major subunit